MVVFGAVLLAVIAAWFTTFTALTRPKVIEDAGVVRVKVRCGYQVGTGNWIAYPFVTLMSGDGILTLRSRLPLFATDIEVHHETVTGMHIRGWFPVWRLVIVQSGPTSRIHRVSIAQPRKLLAALEESMSAS